MSNPNDSLFSLDAAIVSSHGATTQAINHKTLDWEIECQEKAVAALEGMLANEKAVLRALCEERDSAQRQARRLTERPDGTPMRRTA